MAAIGWWGSATAYLAVGGEWGSMVWGLWLRGVWWVGLVEQVGVGFLRGGRWCLDYLVGGSHREVVLREAVRGGVFGDSGAWETALLRLFDKFFRGGVWATLLPLSDHGIGESAAVKLGGLLYSYVPQSSVRVVFCLNRLLRGLLLALGLLIGILGCVLGGGSLL